jgi:hypothetical protein
MAPGYIGVAGAECVKILRSTNKIQVIEFCLKIVDSIFREVKRMAIRHKFSYMKSRNKIISIFKVNKSIWESGRIRFDQANSR